MKLVSKKNGTTTIFPNLISAIASKIGFTPPTGMSSTNVQDAIEEVNSNRDWTMKIIDGNATFNVPASAKECIAIMRYGHPTSGLQALSWSFSFPNPRVFPATLTLTNGHFQDTNSSKAIVQITVSTSGDVKPTDLIISGTDYISTSKTYLYYR